MNSSNSNSSNSKPNKPQKSASKSDSKKIEATGTYFEYLRFSKSLEQWIYYTNPKTELVANLSRGIYDPRTPVDKQKPSRLEKKATFEELDISFRQCGKFAFAFPNKKPEEGTKPFPGGDKHKLLKIYYGFTQYSLEQMDEFAENKSLDTELEKKAQAAYNSIPYDKVSVKGIPKNKTKDKTTDKDKYNSDCEMSEGEQSEFDSGSLESDDDNSPKTAGAPATLRLTCRQLELEKNREKTNIQNKQYDDAAKQRADERTKERKLRRAALKAAKKKQVNDELLKPVKIEKANDTVDMDVDQSSTPINPSTMAVKKTDAAKGTKRFREPKTQQAVANDVNQSPAKRPRFFPPVPQQEQDYKNFSNPVKLRQPQRLSPTLFGKKIFAFILPSEEEFLNALELKKLEQEKDTGRYFKIYYDTKTCLDARDFFEFTAKNYQLNIEFISVGCHLYLGITPEKSAQAKSDLENASRNYRAFVKANKG